MKEPSIWDKVFGDANEHFVGDELNRDKLQTLNTLRDLCYKLSAIDRTIKYTPRPFDNRRISASVIVDLPDVHAFEKKEAKELVSQAFTAADSVITSTSPGNLRIAFLVKKMWNTYHYEDYTPYGEN